jgi:hypothetical protein
LIGKLVLLVAAVPPPTLLAGVLRLPGSSNATVKL